MNNNIIIIVISLLVAAGSVAYAVYAMDKQHKLTKSLDEERYSRMVAEEASQKSAAKAATLENRLKQADTKLAAFKDILDQEKNVTADLKKQYDKLVRVKADLEAKLKVTLDEKVLTMPAVTPVEQNAAAGAGEQ